MNKSFLVLLWLPLVALLLPFFLAISQIGFLPLTQNLMVAWLALNSCLIALRSPTSTTKQSLILIYCLIILVLPILVAKGWILFFFTVYILPLLYFGIAIPTIVKLIRSNGTVNFFYFVTMMGAYSLAILFCYDYAGEAGFLGIESVVSFVAGHSVASAIFQDWKYYPLNLISLLSTVVTIILHIFYIDPDNKRKSSL